MVGQLSVMDDLLPVAVHREEATCLREHGAKSIGKNIRDINQTIAIETYQEGREEDRLELLQILVVLLEGRDRVGLLAGLLEDRVDRLYS